jgi:hypothetical protein
MTFARPARREGRTMGAMGCTASSAAWTALLALAGAVGCTSGSSSDGPSSEAPFLDGPSYELTLHEIVAEAELPGPPASEGVAIRLDLPVQPSADDAVATPPWGEPAAMTVETTPSEIVLRGELMVERYLGVGHLTADTWTTVRLARDDDGRLSGGAQAEGRSGFRDLDTSGGGPSSAVGTLGADVTPPGERATIDEFFAADSALLPWGELPVQVSEPVLASQVTSGLSLVPAPPAAGSDPLPVTWELVPPDAATAWAGSSRAVGRLSSWDGLVAAVELRGAPLGDWVGNMSAGLVQGLSLAVVAPPVAGFDLDSETPALLRWGAGEVWGLGGQPDPRCEQGGCVLLGYYGAGLAGRIAPLAGKSSLVVRYRVVAGNKPGWGDDAPDQVWMPFTAELAVPGGRAVLTTAPGVAPIERDDGYGDLHWVAPWQILTLPLPDAEASEVGFSVHISAPAFNNPFSYPLAQPEFGVVIDSIALE